MNNTTKAIAALVGVTGTDDAALKLIKARVYGIEVRTVCGRCGGGGRYSFNGSHSICYGCEGRGEVATDLTKKSTLEAVKVAINSGALVRYHAARVARAAAKKALVPLYKACDAAYSACYAEIHAASGFAKYGDRVSHDDTHAFVASVAFNMITENSDLHDRAFKVDLARRFNDLDIDQGVLFAEVILREVLAATEALRETVASLTAETLREPMYPAQVCKACGQSVEFMGSARRGQRSSCNSLRQYKGTDCNARVICGE